MPHRRWPALVQAAVRSIFLMTAFAFLLLALLAGFSQPAIGNRCHPFQDPVSFTLQAPSVFKRR